MNLQQNMDIRKIIKYSLHLHNAKKYPKPEGVFQMVHPRNIQSKAMNHTLDNGGIPRSGTMPSRQMSKISPKDKVQDIHRQRSNSLKLRSAVNSSMRSSEVLYTSNNHELGISDGYLEDDPVMLKMNVDYLMKVMDISRLKLQQYVNNLRETLPVATQREVASTLDGLEELCAFMQPRPQTNGIRNGNASTSSSYMSPPVERAFAADELENGTYQGTPLKASTPKTGDEVSPKRGLKLNGRPVGDQKRQWDLSRGLSEGGCDTELGKDSFALVEVENASDSQTMIMTASMVGDLEEQEQETVSINRVGHRGSMEVHNGQGYEPPVHRMPRTVARAMANRKEVELQEFAPSSDADNEHHSWGSDFVPSADPLGERQD